MSFENFFEQNFFCAFQELITVWNIEKEAIKVQVIDMQIV